MCNMLPAWFSGITQCSAGTSTANILQNQHVSRKICQNATMNLRSAALQTNYPPVIHTGHTLRQPRRRLQPCHCCANYRDRLGDFLPEKKLFARITRVRPRVSRSKRNRIVLYCSRARFCRSLLIWVDYSSQVQGPSDTLYTVGNFQDDFPSQSLDWCKTPPKLNTFWYHKVSGLPRRSLEYARVVAVNVSTFSYNEASQRSKKNKQCSK